MERMKAGLPALEVTCPRCEGRGRVYQTVDCSACGGTGRALTEDGRAILDFVSRRMTVETRGEIVTA